MNPDPELSGNVRVELLQDASVKHIIIIKILVCLNRLESWWVRDPNFHHHWRSQHNPCYYQPILQFESNPSHLGRSLLLDDINIDVSNTHKTSQTNLPKQQGLLRCQQVPMYLSS